jgi:hypothetical protein
MSGFALGVACLFRHDIGALLLLAEAVFIAGIMANRTHGDVIHALRSLGLYLAAVAGPGVIATTLLLAYGVPAGDLIDALVIYPFTGYVAGRSLPLPPLIPDTGPLLAGGISIVQYAAGLRTGLRFYFPVVVLALVTAVLAIRRRAAPAGELWPVAFVTLIGLCLLPYAWVNSDLAHIVPAWAPALLLFAWLLHQLPARGASRATGLALGVVWSVVFVWGALGAKTDALIGTILGASGLPLDPPRGAHIVAGPDAASMQAAIRYVQSVVPPGERIFVGNAQHDSLVLNDVMFYFLADRRSGTRYHELVPGVATTVAVQTRIVRDLEVHRVRYIVLRADPGYVPSIGGARTLDEFIQQQFAPIQTFGNYGVWRRRENRP